MDLSSYHDVDRMGIAELVCNEPGTDDNCTNHFGVSVATSSLSVSVCPPIRSNDCQLNLQTRWTKEVNCLSVVLDPTRQKDKIHGERTLVASLQGYTPRINIVAIIFIFFFLRWEEQRMSHNAKRSDGRQPHRRLLFIHIDWYLFY